MSKWIPVSKELPKRKGEYLVTMRGSGGGRWVDVEEFSHTGFHPWVIAWQPLTRPYKGEVR